MRPDRLRDSLKAGRQRALPLGTGRWRRRRRRVGAGFPAQPPEPAAALFVPICSGRRGGCRRCSWRTGRLLGCHCFLSFSGFVNDSRWGSRTSGLSIDRKIPVGGVETGLARRRVGPLRTGRQRFAKRPLVVGQTRAIERRLVAKGWRESSDRQQRHHQTPAELNGWRRPRQARCHHRRQFSSGGGIGTASRSPIKALSMPSRKSNSLSNTHFNRLMCVPAARCFSQWMPAASEP